MVLWHRKGITMAIEQVEQAIKDLQAGRIILVTDDEDRENEGDLICAAEFATTENVNFMATHAKGLICMPMSKEIAERLNFPQMVTHNTDHHETAFTVSVDYWQTSTGISAEERGLTARMVVDEASTARDFRRPGHMFPLVAKPMGVLERNGHTEATVDFLRLAGLKECGLCCEIMADDGRMMRYPQLKAFAQEHQITMVTIKDLQKYRKIYDELLVCSSISAMPTKYGDFVAHCFVNRVNQDHHVALVKGDISSGEDVLCRVHSECLTGDAFGSLRCDCGQQLAAAMQAINQEGRGISLYMRQEGRGIGLVNKLQAYALQDQGLDTLQANHALGFAGDLRDYYAGAQILRALGVKTLRLLTNNPDKVYQLEEFGLKITERLPIIMPVTPFDQNYLRTKQVKMGHLLNIAEGQ